MTSDDARRSLINIGILKRLMAGALGVVAILLRIWNRLTQRPNSQQSDNVLLLEPFGMGDVISYEPLFRVLRQHGKRVTLCARSEWRPLFPDAAWLDCHAAWGQHLPGEKYRFRAYFNPAFRKFLADLRSHGRGGIGISNTQSRLKQLFGSNFSFSLSGNDHKGVTARLELPFISK